MGKASRLLALFLFPVIPNLPTVEQVLQHRIEGQIDRCQRVQVMVGHPNAHGGVFLPEQLSARYGVAVLVPNPLAQPELDDAEQQCRNAEPKDAVPVALAMQKDEINGLAQGEEQGDSPKIERQTLVAAEEMVGAGPPQLQGQGHEKRQAYDRTHAPQNLQERLKKRHVLIHADEGKIDGRDNGNQQVANHRIGCHGVAVGAEHGADDRHRGRHGAKHPYQHAFSNDFVDIQQPEQGITAQTHRHLEQHNPNEQRPEAQFQDVDRRKGEQKDGEDDVRRHHDKSRAIFVQQQPQHNGNGQNIASDFLHCLRFQVEPSHWFTPAKIHDFWQSPFYQSIISLLLRPIMSDIAAELAKLHVLVGAEFVIQLKSIAARSEFHPLQDEPNIFTTGGESSEDYDNLITAARKAIELGYRVYVLPNPKGIRTADFIFEQHGIYKMYDLKTIQGKTSVGNRLLESIGQTNHVLLNMNTRYNGGRLAAEIKSYFHINPKAVEVLIFKGKQVFTVKRKFALQKSFIIDFRKRYG